MEVFIFLVQLQEAEKVSFANHLVAIHVKHLEGKAFEGAHVFDWVPLISMGSPVIDEEDLLESLVEDVVFDGDVGPVKDRG